MPNTPYIYNTETHCSYIIWCLTYFFVQSKHRIFGKKDFYFMKTASFWDLNY